MRARLTASATTALLLLIAPFCLARSISPSRSFTGTALAQTDAPASQPIPEATPEATPEQNREAEAAQNLAQGLLQLQNSDYQQALQSFQAALQIYEAIDNSQGELIAVNSLGATYFQLGQYRQSIELSERSLAMMQATAEPNPGMRIVTLSNLGLSYQYLGQFARSVASFQQALDLAQTSNQPLLVVTSLVSLGDVYRTIGQYEQAIRLFEQGLALLRSPSDPAPDPSLEPVLQQARRQAEAGVLVNLGIAYTAQKQYPQAIDLLQQALTLAQNISDRQMQARALLNLGGAHLTSGQPQRALGVFQQSLDLAREIGDRHGEAIALGNLGYANRELGNFDQAVASYQQSIAIKRETGDRQGEAISLSNYGYALLKAGRPQQAEPLIYQAIEILESLRTGFITDSDRVALIDTQNFAYENLQNVLVARNQPEAALEAAERGRARAFVELLSRHLAIDSSTQNAQNQSEQNQNAQESAATSVPSIADIRRIARQQNATLVQYSIIDNEKLFIWVVKPTGEVAFRQTNFPDLQQGNRAAQPEQNQPSRPSVQSNRTPADLEADADQLDRIVSATRGAVIADRESNLSNRLNFTRIAQLRQLHQLLIEPIADLLPTAPDDRIIFIPQGSLFLVPFPALQDDSGNYLIQKHTMSIAPSIQILDLTENLQGSAPSAASSALIVGNPTMPTLPALPGEPAQNLSSLPGAEHEAKQIAQLFQTEAIVGTQATETAVVQQMASAKIVHLATHGLLTYGQPDEYGVLDTPGAIALAPSTTDDGLLTASEILGLDLHADLVVLSACNTGRGRITGDGIVGLSRSLIAAGVPSVVVSLWAASDIPTSDLMTQFYRQLQQNPDKARALRQAMLETMKQHPHPRDWAAFTLIGATK